MGVAVLVEVRIQSFLTFISRGLAVTNFTPYPVYFRGKITSKNPPETRLDDLHLCRKRLRNLVVSNAGRSAVVAAHLLSYHPVVTKRTSACQRDYLDR
jgi:hypothetical protein